MQEHQALDLYEAVQREGSWHAIHINVVFVCNGVLRKLMRQAQRGNGCMHSWQISVTILMELWRK